MIQTNKLTGSIAEGLFRLQGHFDDARSQGPESPDCGRMPGRVSPGTHHRHPLGREALAGEDESIQFLWSPKARLRGLRQRSLDASKETRLAGSCPTSKGHLNAMVEKAV